MKRFNMEMFNTKILLAIQLLGVAMFVSAVWNKSGIIVLFISLVLTISPLLLTGRWRARLGYVLIIIGTGFTGMTLHIGWDPAWAICGAFFITAGVYEIFRDFIDHVSIPRKALEKISKSVK